MSVAESIIVSEYNKTFIVTFEYSEEGKLYTLDNIKLLSPEGQPINISDIIDNQIEIELTNKALDQWNCRCYSRRD